MLHLADAPHFGPRMENVVQAWDSVSQFGDSYLRFTGRAWGWVQRAPILKETAVLWSQKTSMTPFGPTSGRTCSVHHPEGTVSSKEWFVCRKEVAFLVEPKFVWASARTRYLGQSPLTDLGSDCSYEPRRILTDTPAWPNLFLPQLECVLKFLK